MAVQGAAPKEAVYARHQLTSAHSDYCRALCSTSSALVTFASGEPLSISDHTPARDRDRERAQARAKDKQKQVKDDGLTPEQRRERDAKALQEKAARKAAQAAAGGNDNAGVIFKVDWDGLEALSFYVYRRSDISEHIELFMRLETCFGTERIPIVPGSLSRVCRAKGFASIVGGI
ncbi:Hypothetical predicted protein [Olea europaea subsp. europaea]|uniref:DUF630 domain-containing protein n=1 Tax=Olea europaea subsp. europaea TaxID=158383 RepID=A0A8S0V1X3_OLEEU|nr:Hypothetical predicted protein [Olea europaea subsp. europaea]